MEEYQKIPDQKAQPMEDAEIQQERGATWPQFIVAYSGHIASLTAGCMIGWTSPSLPKLESDDSPIKITTEQNSWISSLMPLAASLGPFAAGYLAEKFGKKKILLLSAIPAVVSWICLALGRSVEMIYVGRFIAGFTVGWIFTVLPTYLGETAQDSVRGAINSLMQVFIAIGFLFDYVVGPYVSYTTLSFSVMVFPILFAVTFIWMPESPYYLIGVNEIDAARRSLMWLRAKSEDGVTEELKIIKADVESSKSKSNSFRDLFATKSMTKGMIITLGLVGLQQLSGINAVLFNAQTIFKRVSENIDPSSSAITTGAVMLIASIATPFVVDRLGRKILLLISAVGMAITLGVLGLCYYLESSGVKLTNLEFLPVLAVVSYIVVYSIGFGPLPWTIMGELFPPNLKALASTLTASFCWLLGFIVTRFFNDLTEMIDNHFTFWLFSSCTIVAIFFVYFLVPETKGKSLIEIQEILES